MPRGGTDSRSGPGNDSVKALILILALASSGADAYFTQRNFGPGFRERDPLARPFVRNTPDLVISSAAGAGLKLYLPHLMRKHGRGQLAREMEISGIAGNTVGAIYSARGHHR